MEKESDIDWKKPLTNNQLVAFLVVMALVGGFIMGYSLGGYSMQQQWIQYHQEELDRVYDTKICLNTTADGGLKWELPSSFS